MKKRVLALFLSMTMVLSMLPAAFAQEPEEGTKEGENIEEILPEDVVTEYTFEETEAGLICRLGEEMLTSCYLPLIVTEEEEQKTYLLAEEPSEDMVIYGFDEGGLGSITEGSSITELTFGEETASYYVKDGKIKSYGEDKYISCNLLAYLCHEDGRVEPAESGTFFFWNKKLYLVNDDFGARNLYTGIYEDFYYLNGKLPQAEASFTVTFEDRIYEVAAGGAATLFTGILNNEYYDQGVKSLITGIRNGKYIFKGIVQLPEASYYVVFDGNPYLVDMEGNAKKVRLTGEFAGRNLNGKLYRYQVDPATGKASVYISSVAKSGSYFRLIRGVLYKVKYKTGRATAYTGVRKGKYYKEGNLGKASKPYYVAFENYVYKVAETGKAVKYVRSRRKKGSYYKNIGSYKYLVSYKTGYISKRYDRYPSRQKLVDCARSYLGYKRSDGSHKKILKIYNGYKPLARGYKVRSWDSWCATYVSAMFIKMEYANIIPLECSCYYQVNYWKKMGRWTENDAYVPSPGDIIYYDWGDWKNYKKTDNRGCPDHVGIVEKVKDGKITVIEGNYDNAVKRRTIKVNGRYIRGFGRPEYVK